MISSTLHSLWTFIFLSFLFPAFLFSQDPPIVWGEIPLADLKMQSFPEDTNASALILCDYGESFIDDEMDVVFNRIVRIKIFTTGGYSWGTHSISLYTDDGAERISDLEGCTYSLKAGDITSKNELNSDDIFKEKVNEHHTRYKFTLPALQPGCIIEFRYTIHASSLWLIRDWVFQHKDPVRWSEYRIRHPKVIGYTAVILGYERFQIRETQETSQIFSGAAAGYFQQKIVPCYQMRWAVKNIGAIRDEPFITTLKNYYNRVDIQLSGYALRGGGVKKLISDWPSLVEDLVTSVSFLKRIENTRRIKKQALEIADGLNSPEEKMKAIYSWVARSIVWSGVHRVTADRDVDDILETKQGDNAEITFLLLSLLQSAGIHGDPVVLSTRSNGLIQEMYPILSQFNYVLARVNIGSTEYYLDATDPLRPIDLLPIDVLNTRGLVIKKDAPQWVTLSTEKRFSNTALAVVTVHEDGSIKGTIEDGYQDYGSLILRTDLKEKKELDVLKDIFDTDQLGITIDSIHISGKETLSDPLKLKAWISSSQYAQSNGDFIYFNPHILHRRWDNPFKTQVRNFPVDYAYLRTHSFHVVLTIPEGFELKDKFYSRALTGCSGAVTYTRKLFTDSSQVRLVIKREVERREIKPEFYKELRDFYGKLAALESDQIVFSRIKKSPGVPGVSSNKKTVPKKGKK